MATHPSQSLRVKDDDAKSPLAHRISSA
jgi:hypothetical protein